MVKKRKQLITEKLAITRDMDLRKIPSASVQSATLSGVLEYMPGPDRGRFMDELHRILVPGGTATLSTPYWSNLRAYEDFTYAWPPLSDASFLCFNKAYREQNRPHLKLSCDFDFVPGYSVEGDVANRSQESRDYALRHYTNVIQALHITLTKRA